MITKKNAHKVFHEIYKRLFYEASPSQNYDEILEQNRKEPLKSGWFRKYYLDQDRQDKIVEEVCDEYGVKKWEVNSFKNAVAMGHSPVGVKDAWDGEENENKK